MLCTAGTQNGFRGGSKIAQKRAMSCDAMLVRDCSIWAQRFSTYAIFCGTEMNITQEGIPSVIPAEACYLGWQESLVLLGKLVEAEIPDQM